MARSSSKSWSTVWPLIEKDKNFAAGLLDTERTALTAYHKEVFALNKALSGASGKGGGEEDEDQRIAKIVGRSSWPPPHPNNLSGDDDE